MAKVTGNDAKQAEGKVNQRINCTCCCVAFIGTPALWVQILTTLLKAPAASAHLTGYYLLQGRPDKPRVMPRRRSTSRLALTYVKSSLPRLFVVWCKAVTETTTMMLIQHAQAASMCSDALSDPCVDTRLWFLERIMATCYDSELLAKPCVLNSHAALRKSSVARTFDPSMLFAVLCMHCDGKSQLLPATHQVPTCD